MFQKDHIPILVDLPNTLDYADIYFIHDLHYGSELFDDRKWAELKDKILAEDKSYICWVGDIMENAYRPQSDKMYKLRIYSNEKRMETTGFYVGGGSL